MDDCGDAFGIARLVDSVVHFSSLTRACLYRINFTVVLQHSRDDGGDVRGLSSRCVNVSVTVSTAPCLPDVPPPPSRIHDFRNGSLLVGLSSPDVRRRRRDDVGVGVVASRLIVVEYTTPPDDNATSPEAAAAAVSRLVADTHDRRAVNGSRDPLTGYDDARTRNLSFYVTAELVDPAVDEFMVGNPSVGSTSEYSNPLVDVSRRFCIYVVRQNRLDGISRLSLIHI